MAAIIDLPYVLSVGGASSQASSSKKPLSALSEAELLPVGASFLSHTRRNLNQHDFAADDAAERKRLEEEHAAANALLENDDLGIPEEAEPAELLASDPKEWKSQDHYAVLGLSALRWKATPEQIKIAHRKKVLKHHPDKKAGASGLSNDDSFFKCIAKAHEILSNPEKRRQFDSVDDAIDDDKVPSGKEKPEKFFALWGPVFEREARFSEPKNGKVPSLGDENSTKDEVNSFYDFWYNFDSWRSFEYLDKDINEGSDNRDEKRYMEKKNKNERTRRKKEDNARLRGLVDRALAADPRIKKFKAEEKAAREAKKGGKGGVAGGAAGGPGGLAAARAALEKKKAEEAAAKAAEEEAKKKKDEEDKASRADAKKAKEAAKKKLKTEKKALTKLVQACNYFQAPGAAAPANVVEAQLNGLDAICASLEPEDVAKLRADADKAGEGKPEEVKKLLQAAADSKGVAAGAFA
ncbi:Zuotin [Tilletia horrida]|uniref:Zuotin n=1 Tax=Tilletia horrida TaxID=155126 RepID=A0AAN6JPC9_9BASI|nr:Zuotin [Tilletia horrida]KAK0534570.1 Zuotin [Tilletia horrida]KAK0540154.1 Zuotin [Tilletia horrida]KAK0567309.1 Zuotin [Tilletia horrida]